MYPFNHFPQEDLLFRVRSIWVRPTTLGLNEIVLQPLTVEEGQTCWICKNTTLVARKNAYEIIIAVSNKKSRPNSKGWKRQRVIVCDHCLETIPELRDAEVLGFGDGRKLPQTYFMEERDQVVV